MGELGKLTRMGESFSGYERNCGYLNIGGTSKPFANVSAISGFDFADDARAVALLDWDHDGDLDAWVTNRTSPRIRLLRNEGVSDNHFVVFRLEGKTCNRDAIGARVEVVLEPTGNDSETSASTAHKSVKTLRAGEGFATQSSKWLHFGLGDKDSIDKVLVRWPGGETESFSGAQVDRWYDLVQGAGVTAEWTPPQRDVQLAASEPETPVYRGKARSILAYPPPLPELEYRTFDGKVASVGTSREKPRLVNLWKSSCGACLAELREFAEEHQQLRDAGLEITALCVDGLDKEADDDEDVVDASGARAILDRMAFPFNGGMATASFLDKLYLTIDQLYIRDIEPAVPISVLLDRDGRVAAIYRARISVDQILADLEILSLTGQARRNAAVPLPGRWFLEKYIEDSHMSRIALALAEHDYDGASVKYLKKNNDIAQDDPRYLVTVIAAGNVLVKKEEFAEAEAAFREALQVAPDDLEVKQSLAGVLASQRKNAEAIPLFRDVIADKPEDVEALVGLGVSLQFVSQPEEAIELYRQALKIDPEHGRANLYLAKFLRYNNRESEAVPLLLRALKGDPDSTEVRFELGMALLKNGESAEAHDHLTAAGQGSNEFLERMNLEAWRLATRESSSPAEREQAVVLGTVVAEVTEHQQPMLLDTLAVAYAAANRFEEAIATLEQAIELLTGDARSQRAAAELAKRLQLFRESKPYVESPQAN